jgi:hypothetical protein
MPSVARQPWLDHVAADATENAMTTAQQEVGAKPLGGPFLIDAHVHCHGCFAPAAFLDKAAAGVTAAARGLGLAGAPIGWLLFAEMRGDHYFDALRAGRAEPAGWMLASTLEDTSLIARRRDSQTMILVAGRQLTTQEGLEVLALGSNAPLPDGEDLPTTVDRVRADGAVAVLPWGFGKWRGRRGRAITRYLATMERAGVFLGDNAGRPALLPPPPQFAQGAGQGLFVLPGSDPLPWPAEAGSVARYGFVLEGAVDARRPTAGLLRLLVELRQQPAFFGRRDGLATCLAKQLAMQWRKHRRTP